jgi:chromosome segregation ATPase
MSVNPNKDKRMLNKIAQNMDTEADILQTTEQDMENDPQETITDFRRDVQELEQIVRELDSLEQRIDSELSEISNQEQQLEGGIQEIRQGMEEFEWDRMKRFLNFLWMVSGQNNNTNYTEKDAEYLNNSEFFRDYTDGLAGDVANVKDLQGAREGTNYWREQLESFKGKLEREVLEVGQEEIQVNEELMAFKRDLSQLFDEVEYLEKLDERLKSDELQEEEILKRLGTGTDDFQQLEAETKKIISKTKEILEKKRVIKSKFEEIWKEEAGAYGKTMELAERSRQVIESTLEKIDPKRKGQDYLNRPSAKRETLIQHYQKVSPRRSEEEYAKEDILENLQAIDEMLQEIDGLLNNFEEKLEEKNIE